MMRSARPIAVLLTASLLAGCSLVGKKKTPTTPTIGNRVAVLVSERDIMVDPQLASIPMTVPIEVDNPSWGQSGGSATKALGHVALGNALGKAWTAEIGIGSGKAARLGGGPVVADGKVFTIDTTSTVRAFSAANGATLWSTRFGEEKGNRASLFGGGVATDGTTVYATNGLGYVSAIDAATGAVRWAVQPAGPMRGAPTIEGGNIYVMTHDNQIFSLKASDGSTNWSSAAALEIAGVFGSGSPAVARGTVVAGFSSGELNAYRYENGRMVWDDALSRTSISTEVATLSDIDADPVIVEGMVYALGQGGRMVALDLISGQRVWELNMAGIATPWVAGEWLFAVNDRAQLVSVQRRTGKIRWISQLRRWEDQKDKQGPISYHGPVLAGGRLILTGSDGSLTNVDPVTGKQQSATRVGSGIRFQPVVAGKTLYVLTDSGRLMAFR